VWPVPGRDWNRDSGQDLLWGFFRILHIHIKITVILEYTRVQQFVFELIVGASPIGCYQVSVGIFSLWIFVEPFHVGMRGRRIEIEVVLFDILAVVSLAVSEPKEPLFNNWISAVPQSERKTELLFIVRKTGQAILAPMVGA